MKTFLLPIVGLYYHRFSERWDELRALEGEEVMLFVDTRNEYDTNAVAAYLGDRQLGYVHAFFKQLAWHCFGGEELLVAPLAEVLEEHDMVRVRVTVEEDWPLCGEPPDNPLAGVGLDGYAPLDFGSPALTAMTALLDRMVARHDPCDEKMRAKVEFLRENGWRDISREERVMLSRIYDNLSRDEVEGYGELSLELLKVLSRMGSKGTRKRLADTVAETAGSQAMDDLLSYLGDEAPKVAALLPEWVGRHYDRDAEQLMATLAYYQMPRANAQAVLTLLALRVRLREEADKRVSCTQSFTDSCLVGWAKESNDKVKMEVVNSFLLEQNARRTNPELAEKLSTLKEERSNAINIENLQNHGTINEIQRIGSVEALPRGNDGDNKKLI